MGLDFGEVQDELIWELQQNEDLLTEDIDVGFSGNKFRIDNIKIREIELKINYDDNTRSGKALVLYEAIALAAENEDGEEWLVDTDDSAMLEATVDFEIEVKEDPEDIRIDILEVNVL